MMEVGTLRLWWICALPSFVNMMESHMRCDDDVESIAKKSGVKSNIKPPPPPATLILNTHTFDEVVLVSSLVFSYVPPIRLSAMTEQRS